MGKTMMAINILCWLGSNNSGMSTPENNFYFHRDKRFHLIDEVHIIPSPETFYNIMDSKRYTIMLATNEAGDIKEPMLNRCIPLVFEPYTIPELMNIARMELTKYPQLTDDIVESLATRFRIPRVLKQTVERLKSIFPTFLPSTVYELDTVLEEVLDIDREGLNPYERLYLNTLRTLGGKASLNLMINTTRIGKTTILRDVEPGLIYRGFIGLSSKGRTLCQ
jgi:Holliday junction resolvasome RuvABC ATP-dependent DNA helicase subunit